MSQNPNGGPNYNPYGTPPPNPNYPPTPAPGTGYGSPQPPSGPNPGYAPGPYGNPPSGPNPYGPPSMPGSDTPHSTYGSPYAPPPPPTPMPSAPDAYYPYDPTVMSQQNSGAGYPAYTPSSPMQPMQPMPTPVFTPQPKKSGGKTVLIAVIALLVIVGGVLSLVFYNNHQQSILQAQATTTAQARVTGTAQAYAAATSQAQATATAVASHYPFSNNLVLNDPLSDNSHVGQYGWDVNDSCSFANGTYHAFEKNSGYVHLCMANTPTFSDFTYEVQMAIKQGGNGAQGGILFRANTASDKFYILYLDTKGNYDLDIQVNNNGNNNRTLKQGTISNYATGFFQVHTVAVVARGPQISLYVDNQLVAQVSDATYSGGQIGVLSSYGASLTEVVYNNAKVWQL